jgi:hypothetical protein
MRVRTWICAGLALAGPPAVACSVSVPWVEYINLMELSGPRVAGLAWTRVYNVLDYQGDGRVVVHGLRKGERFPIAKWQDGQQCIYDRQGSESCAPNMSRSGVRLEGLFGDWLGFSNRREELRRAYLPLIVEANGREYRLTLSSRPVRNTGALEERRSQRIVHEACEYIDSL